KGHKEHEENNQAIHEPHSSGRVALLFAFVSLVSFVVQFCGSFPHLRAPNYCSTPLGGVKIKKTKWAIYLPKGSVVNKDIDFILDGWDYKPGVVQARLVQARGGRQVIQMRVDLGILQIETTAKPDGSKPHGHATYLSYLREQARASLKTGGPLTLSEEQCQ